MYIYISSIPNPLLLLIFNTPLPPLKVKNGVISYNAYPFILWLLQVSAVWSSLKILYGIARSLHIFTFSGKTLQIVTDVENATMALTKNAHHTCLNRCWSYTPCRNWTWNLEKYSCTTKAILCSNFYSSLSPKVLTHSHNPLFKSTSSFKSSETRVFATTRPSASPAYITD